ncbi:MAG: hypothetical protein V3U90_04635 [Dehalococcoidia bacterium]
MIEGTPKPLLKRPGDLWQVSSPPPEENFAEIPQVVDSPYPYGMWGAVHAIVAPAGAGNGEHEGPPKEVS